MNLESEATLLEKEEEAAADQLHLQALLDVAVEEREQLGDVGERQDQQRHLQLTGEGEHGSNAHTRTQSSAVQTVVTGDSPRPDLLYDI